MEHGHEERRYPECAKEKPHCIARMAFLFLVWTEILKLSHLGSKAICMRWEMERKSFSIGSIWCDCTEHWRCRSHHEAALLELKCQASGKHSCKEMEREVDC